jgi:CheY-like chemotaxis protein
MCIIKIQTKSSGSDLLQMHTIPVLNFPGSENESSNKENGEIFTVCTQCKRVLLTKKVTSIRVGRDEEDQWINADDISNSRIAQTNLSHGLCATCFLWIEASLASPPPSPLSRNPFQKSAKSSSLPQLSFKRDHPPIPTRVLVVDDNKLQRQIHKRMVDQAGFECDVATSGSQAIDMVTKHAYSLILMDLMMGDTDGWSTATKIRTLVRQTLGEENLPKIVAVTGLHIDSKLIHKCSLSGMETIIQKPVSQNVLRKLLSSVHTTVASP